MCINHYGSLSRQARLQTQRLLQRELRPKDYSPRCSAWLLLSCLVLATVASRSLSAVAALRDRCPSRETLRRALLTTLPHYDGLRRRLPGLLRGSLPSRLRQAAQRRRYPLAIDLHGVPYYKRTAAPPARVRKGKRQPGTSYSHQYATAALLRKGQYYTVALTPYVPGESLAELVRRLLRQATANGFAPRYVLMDRGFWSADVFAYLQRARYPFVIPVQARGKPPKKPAGPSGTYVFLHDCRPGQHRYTVRSKQKRAATLTIVVLRKNRGGRRGKHGRFNWAYGVWGMAVNNLPWVNDCYRRRFRIESSYRLLESGRGRTSSRDEGWRLWYVVLAVLLLNAWLALRQPKRTQALRHWWNVALTILTFQLLTEAADSGPPAPELEPPT